MDGRPPAEPRRNPDMTTGFSLTEWLASVAADGSIRPTTAKAYEVAIRVHVIPRLERVPL